MGMRWERDGNGISLWQVRVGQLPLEECGVDAWGGYCLPELGRQFARQNTSSFGYNWTSPGSPLDNSFKWYTAEEMGAEATGEWSAHSASYRHIPPGGFASYVIPFFSDVLLPEQRGPASQVCIHIRKGPRKYDICESA